MIWKILLQAVCLCIFFKLSYAMEVFADLPNYDEPRFVNVERCYHEYVFISKVHGSVAIVGNIVNYVFPDFVQENHIFLLFTLYSTALYAAASFDNHQYYLLCENEEDKMRLEKMFSHQQSQAYLYGAGSLCLLSNEFIHPMFCPTIARLGLVFFLVGVANSFFV